MEHTPVVEIKNLYHRYEYDYVLKNINIQIHKGDFLALIGPNGSGKSTLIKLILGLLKVQEGEIFLYGKPLEYFRQREQIGYVSQKANSFHSGFPATVFEVVRSGLTKKTGLFRFFPKNTKELVMNALETVEMEKFADRNISELSGGQQQRIFIARAIVGNPDLLILDEPTVGVDVKHVMQFYDLLERLNRERNMTLVLVTHDIGTVVNRVSHIACLNRTLHFHGSVADFNKLGKKEITSLFGHGVEIP